MKDTHERTQGEVLQMAREVDLREESGPSVWSGVCVRHAWPCAQDRPELLCFWSDSQLPLCPKESPLQLARPDPSVPVNVV